MDSADLALSKCHLFQSATPPIKEKAAVALFNLYQGFLRHRAITDYNLSAPPGQVVGKVSSGLEWFQKKPESVSVLTGTKRKRVQGGPRTSKRQKKDKQPEIENDKEEEPEIENNEEEEAEEAEEAKEADDDGEPETWYDAVAGMADEEGFSLA